MYVDFTGGGASGNGVTCNVRTIGKEAFAGCNGLFGVTFPNTLVTLGEKAFEGCTNLGTIPGHLIDRAEELSLPEGLVLPYGLQSIGDNAFNGCRDLGFVTLPDGLQSIGDNAFNGCSLGCFTIPESVTTIGENVLGGCSGLQYIESHILSPSVISESTFSNIDTTIPLYVPERTKTLYSSTGGWNVFMNILEKGKDIFLQYTIDEERATASVTGYKFFVPEDVIIPETIYDGAFTVNSIGDDAFRDCSMKSVSIPKTIVSIGIHSFTYCEGLEIVKSYIETPFEIPVPAPPGMEGGAEDPGAFPGTISGYEPILYVPKGTKSLYESTFGWDLFYNIIEMEDPIVADDISISSVGIRTYCSEYDLDFTDIEGLKAYIASGFSPSTGELLLTRVFKVPAGEGILLKGDEGKYDIPRITTDMYYMNLLKGVATSTTISPTDGSYTNYILANGSYGISFYTISETGQIDAGKAYLQLPTSAAHARNVKMVFDDEDGMGDASGIVYINGINSISVLVFDLQGRHVVHPHCGLYLINGKKVYIK